LGRTVGTDGGGGGCRDWSSVFAIGRDRVRVRVRRRNCNCNCNCRLTVIVIAIATSLMVASASASLSDGSADDEEWSEWQDVYSIDETGPWYKQGIQFV